ncbi:MAG: ThuA domain-containing protein [Fuerstiella sp.]|nr:ThuA domain-containing protein [Fuerstiella sp.]
MIPNLPVCPHLRSRLAAVVAGLLTCSFTPGSMADDRLELKAPHAGAKTKHIVLIAGDEEYRSEESMPMLAKILSQYHAYNCTVLFSFGPEGADYLDPNNQQGLRGLEALQSADLMIIGTRFRQPSADQAKYITEYLNAGRPVIGIRTATHAFNGEGTFGSINYGEFGRKILGEQWVSHHGRHKSEGARGAIQAEFAEHPILNGVRDVFAPSDVYGVIHLTDDDQILLRGAVTASLDPKSDILSDDPRNDPMQPFAWLHTYTTPDGNGEGQSFCTTAGASVDLLSDDLRRMIVNAVYYLTDREVLQVADVRFVDPFYPSFYGFIHDESYWRNAKMTPNDYGSGKSPQMPDPPGSPKWPFRPVPGEN